MSVSARSGGTSGFDVEYFDGPDLQGAPVRTAVATKSELGFFGPRNRWVDYDSFSLRMTGRHRFERSGLHTFTASAFGRMRVWFDGELVADLWDQPDEAGDDWVGPRQQHTWEHDAGQGDAVDIVIEYGSVPGRRWRSVRLGCGAPGAADPMADAVAVARDSDVAVVVVGLGSERESEGTDRPDMRLPGDQNRLVAEIATVQPNTIVVVAAGSPIEMPWLDDVAAVLYAWYGGQESGHALADVLLGREDPGGRLPVTFPVTARLHPGMLNYPGDGGVVRYGEGPLVGYRGFDRMQLTPLFEFGHGLSFTSFTLESADVEASDGVVAFRATVTNTGERPGTEVVQVYAVDGEERKLAWFQKIRLESSESRTVEGTIDPQLLRRWDVASGGWVPHDIEALEIRGSFGRTRVAIDRRREH